MGNGKRFLFFYSNMEVAAIIYEYFGL